ncbi:MAG: hypothetical protein R3343_14890 [Nitriliruptorales bacterium]|nr:hypothetical protein [Nitriliruptorales bacterium]
MGSESSWDEALARLEDVLLELPDERALPGLDEILERAGVSEEFLRGDERAAKVLHEAIVGRPLSSVDEVASLKLEVELLTLEVEVLTARLTDDSASREQIEAAVRRLGEVRGRLEELQQDL